MSFPLRRALNDQGTNHPVTALVVVVACKTISTEFSELKIWFSTIHFCSGPSAAPFIQYGSNVGQRQQSHEPLGHLIHAHVVIDSASSKTRPVFMIFAQDKIWEFLS